MQYWRGPGIIRTQTKELERQRGEWPLLGAVADKCKNSTQAQAWLCTKNGKMSVWTGHTTPFSLNMYITQLYPAFSWPTTPRTFCDSPRPASAHPPEHTNSYQDSESHFLGSLLSMCKHSCLLCWCTWRRGVGKPWCPSHIHPYLWANDELMKHIGLSRLNEDTRKE